MEDVQREKPKGNGIKDCLCAGPCVYAVVFWRACARGVRLTLAAFLPVSCGKYYLCNPSLCGVMRHL